jgi:hypothetical protein
VRRGAQFGHLGVKILRDMTLIMDTILLAFLAHLIEMGLWAALFEICGKSRTSQRCATTPL